MVVLYSHLFVGARGCPGGVGALRMFLRRLARSYGPLLGSNCGVDFVDGRSKCATRALGSRASSRRTHKSGREAPRYYSWRFRRAGLQLKGPPVAEGRLDRTPSPQQLEKQECATNVISGARGPGGEGRRSVRAPAAGFAA